jgi:prevent-host-death family protein
MLFHTVRDLRTQPAQVWDNLKEQGEIVITNNGKPTALMVPISESDFEDTAKAVRRAKLQVAIRKSQDKSMKSGKSEMTMDEINAEIKAARTERHQ